MGKDNSIIRMGLFSYAHNTAQDINIFLLDNGLLSGFIKAEKALWDGEWTLINVSSYLHKEGNIVHITEMPYPYLDSPKNFQKWLKTTQEMRIGELLAYIKRLNRSGYQNPKLTVDLHSRLSYPFVNLFMLIIGVCLPIERHMRRGLIAAGIGLFICLIYWTGYILSISMGNAGIIPPFLAPWITPTLFALLALNMCRKLPE
jgi:lipopolysaccharide export LptBFGC system permease protein LptF